MIACLRTTKKQINALNLAAKKNYSAIILILARFYAFKKNKHPQALSFEIKVVNVSFLIYR